MSQYTPIPEHLMSVQVTGEAIAYADRYTTPRSPAVEKLAEETVRAVPIPMMLGGAVEARFLEGLVVISGARRVLEIGTLTGATALTLAEALRGDGTVTTVEVNPDNARIARRHIDASPHRNKVELIVGDAREVLAQLSGPYDLVFIDALKAQYVDYYEAVLPMLSERGVIVADNVIWMGLPFLEAATDEETKGVRRFVSHVQQDRRTRNALLTVGDGLLMIWKTPA
jgi:caffeoyl-CoA O-methyltransferase